jgi:hypothetical protein
MEGEKPVFIAGSVELWIGVSSAFEPHAIGQGSSGRDFHFRFPARPLTYTHPREYAMLHPGFGVRSVCDGCGKFVNDEPALHVPQVLNWITLNFGCVAESEAVR